MFTSERFWIDVGGGAGLVLALFVIFLVDRAGSPAGPGKVENTLEVKILEDEAKRLADTKKLRLLVTRTQESMNPFTKRLELWDDMGKLLRELGEGFRFDEINANQIAQNQRLLDNYDVLFFTCAPGGQELGNQLNQFASRGGTLYASDWRFDAVRAAFPDVIDNSMAGWSGTSQSVQADVVDPELREIIGPTIPLRFDLPEWKVAAFTGPRVTTLIQGRFQRQRHQKDGIGVPATAPFLVKFTFGKGTVIFTSFHNEKQNSELEKKLLKHLVFTLVTADIDAQVMASTQEAGFAPQKSNLLSTPRESPSVARTYTLEKKGPLRVAMGFRNEGATLRLNLRSPDDKSFTWEGTSTVIMEVPNAAPGEWRYTVTAVQVPYDNFPFTVNISEKK